MKKAYFNLLGKKVFPIVKRSQYGAANWDTDGNLNYLNGEARTRYAKRVVDIATKEARERNKKQSWEVFSIHSDGTFTLMSDMGYEQSFVSRSDFRILS